MARQSHVAHLTSPPPRSHVTMHFTWIYSNMIVINLYSLEFLKSDHSVKNATPSKTKNEKAHRITRKHRPRASRNRSRPAPPQHMVDAESQSQQQMQTNTRGLTAAQSKTAPPAWPHYFLDFFPHFCASFGPSKSLFLGAATLKPTSEAPHSIVIRAMMQIGLITRVLAP